MSSLLLSRKTFAFFLQIIKSVGSTDSFSVHQHGGYGKRFISTEEAQNLIEVLSNFPETPEIEKQIQDLRQGLQAVRTAEETVAATRPQQPQIAEEVNEAFRN